MKYLKKNVVKKRRKSRINPPNNKKKKKKKLMMKISYFRISILENSINSEEILHTILLLFPNLCKKKDNYVRVYNNNNKKKETIERNSNPFLSSCNSFSYFGGYLRNIHIIMLYVLIIFEIYI